MDKVTKPNPSCPYCGSEMDHWYSLAIGRQHYVCPECYASSPAKEDELEAYTAAMQRWQEPNRVLSLSELEAMAKEATDEDRTDDFPVWIEFKSCQPDMWSKWFLINDVITWCNGHKSLGVDNMGYINDKELGHEVRCWLRKPTQAEMEDTPWETK